MMSSNYKNMIFTDRSCCIEHDNNMLKSMYKTYVLRYVMKLGLLNNIFYPVTSS